MPNNWDDLEAGSGSGKFIKLIEGANKLRILSKPIAYWKNMDASPKLMYLTKEEAAKDAKAKQRFMCWAIDRNDNAIKRFDFTGSILGQLKDFLKNPEYAFEGTVWPFDVTVNRTGSGLDTTYTVTPARSNTPLNDAETAAVKLLRDMTLELRDDAVDGDKVQPF